MTAYEKGHLHGKTMLGQINGRAYESDKANNAYFQGYAAGLRELHASQMIVQCTRDNTIFPAYPQGGTITCPTCARRYKFELQVPGYPGPGWYSDRALNILIPEDTSDRPTCATS